MAKHPSSLKVTAKPFSELIQSQPLPWEVPMRELLHNQEGAERTWKRLYYAFRLDDPRKLPAVPIVLNDDERAVLERFVEQAKTVAKATLLGASDSVKINIMDITDEESIEAVFSDTDVTVGFMVLLRQCYADGEEASFSKASKILGRRVNEQGDDGAQVAIKSWHRAHSRLGNKTLEELVQYHLIADGLMPAQLPGPDGLTSAVVPSPAPPKELFAKLWYGGQVHWGKHRTDMADIQADPFDNAMWQITTRQAAVELAHFYLGYALLIETALAAALPER
jgi:hypothetical protein